MGVNRWNKCNKAPSTTPSSASTTASTSASTTSSSQAPSSTPTASCFSSPESQPTSPTASIVPSTYVADSIVADTTSQPTSPSDIVSLIDFNEVHHPSPAPPLAYHFNTPDGAYSLNAAQAQDQAAQFDRVIRLINCWGGISLHEYIKWFGLLERGNNHGFGRNVFNNVTNADRGIVGYMRYEYTEKGKKNQHEWASRRMAQSGGDGGHTCGFWMAPDDTISRANALTDVGAVGAAAQHFPAVFFSDGTCIFFVCIAMMIQIPPVRPWQTVPSRISKL